LSWERSGGAGWCFFFPWQEWGHAPRRCADERRSSELIGIHTRGADGSLNPLAVVFGATIIILFYSLIPLYWMKKKNSDIMKKLGFFRYNLTAFLFLTMIALPIKMVLRIGLNIKYILVTPWFNI
jgi:fumarate reductase subunit D